MGERFDKGKAQGVTQGHFRNACGDAAFFYGSGSLDLAVKNQLMYPAQVFPQHSKVKHIAFQQRRTQEYHLVPCCLELTGNRFASVDHIHRKGNQGGRYMQVHKAAGHTVLAAYRRNFHTVQYRVGA